MKHEKLILPRENLFFSADSHFCHSNIISFSNRPYADAEEMNETLITNWNNVVPENGTVFHLGDVAFCDDKKKVKEILDRLNGKIYLIKGNHEKSVLKHEELRRRFEWIKDYFELEVDLGVANARQFVVLCHYPMASWNKSFHGSWALHGHTHMKYKSEYGLILDVGVDNPLCNYAPIFFDRIHEYMGTRIKGNI